MKSCIQGSCISVPVPTELYVSLLDYLSKSGGDYDEPTTAVTAILQKYLDEAQTNPTGQSGMAATPLWSHDWIMFGSPLAATVVEAQESSKTCDSAHRNDWCIGGDGPSADLLSA